MREYHSEDVRDDREPESETYTCPSCGREYEPDFDSREDAPPGSIGREQHHTGLCSEGCWDDFAGFGAESDES